MIKDNCILRRCLLPLVPCDEKRCDWYVYESSCNNCFWVLSELFADGLVEGLSIEEIAKMENLTPEEVSDIYETALTKCRNVASGLIVKRKDE